MRVGRDKLVTHHPLFGQILLKQGKITVEQLDEAIQRQLDTKTYLGEVLVEMGFIAAEDIMDALDIQRSYYPDSGGP
jgi:hypothetical protein